MSGLEHRVNSLLSSAVEMLENGDMLEKISFMGMVFNNTTGVLIKVNSNLCKYLGYTEEEMIGRVYLDFVFKEDLDHTLKAKADFEQNKATSIFFKNHWVAKNGEPKTMHWVRERAEQSAFKQHSFGFAFETLTTEG